MRYRARAVDAIAAFFARRAIGICILVGVWWAIGETARLVTS